MRSTILLLAAAALIGAARADDWPLVRHDATNSGASVQTLKPPFTKVWTKRGATKEPLLVAGDTLLYTSRRYGGLRDLQAVAAATGKPLWTLKNVTQPGAASAKAGLLFTVLRTSEKPTSVSRLGANLWPAAIAGVDLKTGKVRWTYPIGDHPTYPATSPVTVSGSAVYLVNIPYCIPGDPCGKAQLISVNAKTGDEIAKYEWDDVWGGQMGVVDGAPLIDANGAHVAIALGYKASADAYGGQVWVFPSDARLKDGPIARLGDPSNGTGGLSEFAHKGGNVWPLLGGSFLAVQGPMETTRVWNVKTFPASLAWEIRFSRGYAHSIMPGGANPMLLEYNSGNGLLTAMYMSTGKNIWSKPIKTTGLSATAGRTVFVPAQARRLRNAGASRGDVLDGILYALDTMTGKALWTERKPDVTFNTPVPANGRLFVSDSDGNLTCYKGK
ncbi:MAG TPA: PQQ-binding-like beta-propeller repeat protein [Armatimonadota bacterium]|jgi:outer membrane protein assembly factor BamB